MRKEKIILIGAVSGLILLIATFGLWFFQAVQKDDLKGANLAIPFIIIMIAALMLPMLIRSYKGIKDNIPAADERSKKAANRAAALTFYISIYLLLAIGWFGDDYFERPSQATGLGILGMAIIFLATWLYFDKKGKL